MNTKVLSCNQTCTGDLTIFTGGAVPAYICHDDGKTILNTTCPLDKPLNVFTGLCGCGDGYATVIDRNADGTLKTESICVPLLLESYHITNCKSDALMVLEAHQKETILCA